MLKRKVINRLFFSLAIVAISACHSNSSIQKIDYERMANPASLYCENQGGRVSFSKSGKGLTGYCLLPDGELVDEWIMYKRRL